MAQRFEFVDDSTSDPDNPLPISANSIEGMAGFTVLNNVTPQAVGIGSTAEAGSYYFFDGTDPSWLIASVTYDVLPTGEGAETELFLEIGPAGMNHVDYDTDEHSVVFGDAMDTPLTDVCVPAGGGCNHIYRGVHPGDDDALIAPRVLPGDADRNGAVEQADFDVWRASFGSTTLLAADHNGNGTVDAADYVIWRKNLGLSAGSGGAVGVPEPSAAVLASIALTALLAARRLSVGRAEIVVAIGRCQQAGHFHGPIRFGFGSTRRGFAPARQRFGEHEDARRAGPLVFVVDAFGMPLRGRDRPTCLFEQLHRLLVHAEHRTGRIIRFFVGVEHFFHRGHELRVGFWRDDPVLNLAVGHAVFFSVTRTVSWLIGGHDFQLHQLALHASRHFFFRVMGRTDSVTCTCP